MTVNNRWSPWLAIRSRIKKNSLKSMMSMMSRKRMKMKPTPTTMKMKKICTVLNLVMKKRIKMAEKKGEVKKKALKIKMQAATS